MSLSIKVNGKDLTNFQDASVIRSMDTLCGRFTFTSSADENELFPVKINDEVEIRADGETVLTGYVYTAEGSHDKGSHFITITGRDKLSDFVDSTVAKAVEFTANIGLDSIIRNVLAGLGIDVKVINKAGTIEKFINEKESQGIGENAFGFCESFSRKRQVLLTSDFESNLILTRGNTGKLKARLQHLKNRDDNNILSARLRQDISDRFNKYIVQGQLDMFYKDESTTTEDAANQDGVAFDNTIIGTAKVMRTSRILEINAEESSDSATAKKRAEWEANIRRARSFDYACKVQGHSVDGEVWNINKLVHIADFFYNMNSEFLCKQVEFRFNLKTGSTTRLNFTYKDAYTLQAEQDQRELSSSEQGEGFFV